MNILLSLFIFQLAFLAGNRIVTFLVLRLKLYRYVLRERTIDPISANTINSCQGSLRHFIKFAKVTPDVPDEYRLYFVKLCWRLAFCVILVLIFMYLAPHLAEGFCLPGKNERIASNLDFRFIPILGYLNFFIAFTNLIRLWRRLKLDHTQTILNDTRKPILYLRSFYHDPPEPALDSEGLISQLDERWAPPLRRSSEDRLIDVLRGIGPVVAVGQPKENIPQLGALRLYFSEDEWQDKVRELMSLSQLVVIQAGYSLGTEWEMLTAKESLRPEQLIFSFVHWQGQKASERQLDYDVFKLQVKRIYGISLPECIGKKVFMYFSATWTPLFADIQAYVFKRTSTSTITRAFRSLLSKRGDQHLAQQVSTAKVDWVFGVMPALIFLVAIISVVAVGHRPGVAYQPCTETKLEQYPELHGFRLGMSMSDIQQRYSGFPSVSADRYGLATIKISSVYADDLLDRQVGDEVISLVSALPFPELNKLKHVELKLLDARLIKITIFYPNDIKQKSADEFARKVGEALEIDGSWRKIDDGYAEQRMLSRSFQEGFASFTVIAGYQTPTAKNQNLEEIKLPFVELEDYLHGEMEVNRRKREREGNAKGED